MKALVCSYAIWADGESVVVAGAGESVYRRVDGATEFERIPDVPGGVQALVSDGAGLRFWDLWRRARDEVFLTVTDESLGAFRCGERRALWYDGVRFHRF